jgi:ribosomal protein S18 acetylase RimI-like enzyme
MTSVTYRISPNISNDELNALFSAAWESAFNTDFETQHHHSLLYVCAYASERVVGYVNVAWDGGIHAFLLDTSVHPDVQHQGIGTQLVREATEAAKARGIEWLHVDFEPHLTSFYRACGFVHTEAGLINLKD